jgi:hypothetical protein
MHPLADDPADVPLFYRIADKAQRVPDRRGLESGFLSLRASYSRIRLCVA